MGGEEGEECTPETDDFGAVGGHLVDPGRLERFRGRLDVVVVGAREGVGAEAGGVAAGDGGGDGRGRSDGGGFGGFAGEGFVGGVGIGAGVRGGEGGEETCEGEGGRGLHDDVVFSRKESLEM